MKATYDGWNNGSFSGESRAARKQRFDYNRAFMMGKQPMDEYMDILDVDGEMSVINLIFDPLPIAMPFIARIKDRYNQRVEKVVCNSIDPFTQDKKKTARDNDVFKMMEKQRIATLQHESGVNIEQFKDDDPEDENEVDMEYGFNYKEREEVLMENGIEIVFYENDFDGVIKDRSLMDTICAGYLVSVVEVDNNSRVKIRNVRPENFIASSSEYYDWRDWQFMGEIYFMSIMDIRQKYPSKVSEQKLFELAKSQRGKNNNPDTWSFEWSEYFTNSPSRPYDNFRVSTVILYLKTLNNITYSVEQDRFGKEVLNRKYAKVPEKEYIDSPAYEVTYTGVWITDTDYLLEWGLSKNMVKPEKNLTEVYSPYVIYMPDNSALGNKPLAEAMIPSIKMMQLIYLQQQKIIASAAPDGFKVDIAFMSDITLGEGMADLTPFQLYKIYKQTGIQYYKSIEDDGDGQRKAPIEPANVPFSSKLDQLMNQWNMHYDILSRIVGDNQLASGQISNQAVGKEVMQNAKQIAQSASNFLYDAFLNSKQRVAKLVQIMLWDMLVFGKKYGVLSYDGYGRALGTDKIENLKLEATDDLGKMAFDVMIQVVLDEQEQANLNNDINQALAQKQIEFHDAVDIRRVAQTDLKYASYLMAARIKRRKKEAAQEAQQNIQQQGQLNAQNAQAKQQGDMQTQQMIHANKMELEDKKQQGVAMQEDYKFSGALKTAIATTILQKPGAKLSDIPDFIFAGLNITNAAQKQTVLDAMQAMAKGAALQQHPDNQQEATPQEAQGQGQPA